MVTTAMAGPATRRAAMIIPAMVVPPIRVPELPASAETLASEVPVMIADVDRAGIALIVEEPVRRPVAAVNRAVEVVVIAVIVAQPCGIARFIVSRAIAVRAADGTVAVAIPVIIIG